MNTSNEVRNNAQTKKMEREAVGQRVLWHRQPKMTEIRGKIFAGRDKTLDWGRVCLEGSGPGIFPVAQIAVTAVCEIATAQRRVAQIGRMTTPVVKGDVLHLSNMVDISAGCLGGVVMERNKAKGVNSPFAGKIKIHTGNEVRISVIGNDGFERYVAAYDTSTQSLPVKVGPHAAEFQSLTEAGHKLGINAVEIAVVPGERVLQFDKPVEGWTVSPEAFKPSSGMAHTAEHALMLDIGMGLYDKGVAAEGSSDFLVKFGVEDIVSLLVPKTDDALVEAMEAAQMSEVAYSYRRHEKMVNLVTARQLELIEEVREIADAIVTQLREDAIEQKQEHFYVPVQLVNGAFDDNLFVRMSDSCVISPWFTADRNENERLRYKGLRLKLGPSTGRPVYQRPRTKGYAKRD